MPIKAVVSTTNDLPDELKALYRAGDTDATKGKFVLDVESVDGFALEHIEGLRTAFATAKADLQEKEKALEPYKGLPAVSTLREKLKQLDKLQAMDPHSEVSKIVGARVDAALTEANSKHATELKAATYDGDRLWGALQSALTTETARSAISAEGGAAALLLPHVSARTKIDRATLAVTVHGEDGTPLYNNAGKPATIEDLVADLKKHPDYGRAFEATASGSGASGNKTPGAQAGGANPWSKSTWNLTDQMRLVRDDPGRAAALKGAANASDRATQGDFNLTAAIQEAKGDPAKLAALRARIGR